MHCLSALSYYKINLGTAAFNEINDFIVIDEIKAKIFYIILLFKSNQDQNHLQTIQDNQNKTANTNYRSKKNCSESSFSPSVRVLPQPALPLTLEFSQMPAAIPLIHRFTVYCFPLLCYFRGMKCSYFFLHFFLLCLFFKSQLKVPSPP